MVMIFVRYLYEAEDTGDQKPGGFLASLQSLATTIGTHIGNANTWLKNLGKLENPLLNSVGLGSWGRVGAAALGVAGLAAAYKAWKSKSRSSDQQQQVNASYVPDYTNNIINEANIYCQAMHRVLYALVEAEAAGINPADQQRAAQITRQIQSKANSSLVLAKNMLNQKDLPADIRAQLTAMVAILERAKNADPTQPLVSQS